MHSAEFGDEMWRFAPILRAELAANPAERERMREALDFVIARRPTPKEWFHPTFTWFFDQQELDDYLRAFHDYLFGDRPEPIYPPDNERLPPESDPTSTIAIDNTGDGPSGAST
ncbi:hypothetical protein ACFVUS_41265 [Nocardia sp. NPDC058058]|uniref:hypothetical protein n=1 Tax=Nocardia sp. NPDC058058 TaxID=3346317 RepID=UPI0036DCC02D